MTETELGLVEIADALNRLALAIAGLVLILIVMSWSLDDMAVRVSMFGFMLRRLTPRQHADEPSTPAAPKAAKEVRREAHAE